MNREQRLAAAALTLVDVGAIKDRRDQLMERAGELRHLPRRWRLACLVDGLVPSAALDAARDFVGSERWVLVLAGARGTGKSVAACWWAVVHSARWCCPQQLVDWRSRELLGGIALDKLSLAHHLVIDDMGTENLSPENTSRLSAVINERYQQNAPTVITTNLKASEFRERYRHRISDRIKERGSYKQIPAPVIRGHHDVDEGPYVEALRLAAAVDNLTRGQLIVESISELGLDLEAVDKRARTIEQDRSSRAERIDHILTDAADRFRRKT